MADISAELVALMNAVYGEEVRTAFRDALLKMNNGVIGLEQREEIYQMTLEALTNAKNSNIAAMNAAAATIIASIPSDYTSASHMASDLNNMRVLVDQMLLAAPSAPNYFGDSDHVLSDPARFAAWHCGLYIDDDGELCECNKRVITNDYYAETADLVELEHSSAIAAKYVDEAVYYQVPTFPYSRNRHTRWYSPRLDKFRDTFNGVEHEFFYDTLLQPVATNPFGARVYASASPTARARSGYYIISNGLDPYIYTRSYNSSTGLYTYTDAGNSSSDYFDD